MQRPEFLATSRKYLTAFQRFFSRYVHKRTLIIVSPHKVKHVAIGAVAQCCMLTLVAVFLAWASYSTGSYVAARHALKAQGQALRSVTSARVDSMSPLAKLAPSAGNDADLSTEDPMFTLSALNENKMIAKVAQLEKQVNDLKSANDEIVQRVREKTAAHIDNLETIIEQTGLSAKTLKKQAGNGKNTKSKAQGGPYLPDRLSRLVPAAADMMNDLDELALLRSIIGNLPLTAPVEDASEESPFGHRVDPFTGHLAFHSGLDLAGSTGAPIHATAGGKVIAAERNGAYGNCVDIDHGFGIVTRYAHLSQILVKEGQTVAKGDTIGIQGSTGRSTGQHVHYEVRYHDEPMNPKNFLVAGSHVVE